MTAPVAVMLRALPESTCSTVIPSSESTSPASGSTTGVSLAVDGGMQELRLRPAAR
ncbi:hypothetical protein [Agromyces humi]|uniref:hypothetical protein n=1 Tax=Agromyces humi TaxID=1766800 RepID=UPI001F355EA2|nr:hypothetical protein [Agromyces humi]